MAVTTLFEVAGRGEKKTRGRRGGEEKNIKERRRIAGRGKGILSISVNEVNTDDTAVPALHTAKENRRAAAAAVGVQGWVPGGGGCVVIR